MRRILLPVIVLLLPFFAFSQKIDSLRTDAEVEAFLQELQSQGRGEERLFVIPSKPVYGQENYKGYLKDFGANTFEKADFDGNGYTDLLANGYTDYWPNHPFFHRRSFVILAFGNDSFQVKSLFMEKFRESSAARVVLLGSQVCIKALGIGYDLSLVAKENQFLVEIDTLACMFDDFVERFGPHKHKDIKGIKYCDVGPEYDWGDFQISIFGDSATLTTHTMSVCPGAEIDSGITLIAKIDPVTLSRIHGLLRYMDLSKLRPGYAIDVKDAGCGTLQISYADGQKWTVWDYGLTGTHGLVALHDIFREMIKTQQWARIGPLIFCPDIGHF